VVQVLKNIGYVLAAILALALFGAVAIAAIAFATAAGLFLCGIVVVGFVAYLIKEFCETKRSP
jgi:hypothetical protein